MNNTISLLSLYKKHPKIAEIENHFRSSNCILHVKGLTGSALSLVATALGSNAPQLVIASEKDDAMSLYHDIIQLTGSGSVFFLPSSYKRSPEFAQLDTSQAVLRTETLRNLRAAQQSQIFVSYPEALMERVPANKTIDEQTLKIRMGEQIDLLFAVDFLKMLGFKRADFVYEPGQYSMRGSILDVYSYSYNDPFRIDFFGDEIESIRSFDIETQLSKLSFNEIDVVANLAMPDELQAIAITELIPQQVKIWINMPAVVIEKMDYVYERINMAATIDDDERELPSPAMFISGSFFKNSLELKNIVIYGSAQGFKTSVTVEFATSPQPLFHKQFNLLEENIRDRQHEGYTVYILSDNEKQLERLRQIFADRQMHLHYSEINHALHEGFIDSDLKLCVYTDHQLFDRYHKFSLQTDSAKNARQAISIKELSRLNPGDYMVHIDHGIGRFGGLVTTEVNGKKQEAVRLVYRDNDVLLVSIHSLHRISKFKGQEGEPPRVHKLGSGAWQQMKEKTRKKIKDIARELIALYARRKKEPGFAFAPDSYMQKELEASFIYEDTPDQYKATVAVKEDMENSSPMDRLVCGDVGFGKTEIAIRAAFKAVADSKQVALLVPTTILAFQHWHTFKERLSAFPCRVEYVSRLRKAADVKKVLADLREGRVDILIGTHRIIGKDVVFNDLGLLIVDEEQRFGVAVKEKLKQIKINVDTLALTATPIPRTLQFSLMGARDLSILNTPPPNRHPIITELHTFSDDIIKEAILYEVERGGQVFMINNRVQNINEIETMLNRLLPSVKTVVAHGQMEGSMLERIMLDFIAGDYDVLIATTIIESGLDIPNANTIIINNAHQFGLSELHQLRGRVGRSNKKAFCYLIAPPLSTLTGEARKRLKILEEFSELGSGFNIAMQDLDIRGAGNILGAEQSGYIADIGYETYQRILHEALIELRETEYPDLAQQQAGTQIEPAQFVTDCQIETDLEIRFPEEYIENIAERMELYRELDNIKTPDKLNQFRSNLVDRFGELPQQSVSLLQIVIIRFAAEKLGMEKIVFKNKLLKIYFVSNTESPFYRSSLFDAIIRWVQINSRIARLEEKNQKRALIVKGTDTLLDIEALLNSIMDMCASQQAGI